MFSSLLVQVTDVALSESLPSMSEPETLVLESTLFSYFEPTERFLADLGIHKDYPTYSGNLSQVTLYEQGEQLPWPKPGYLSSLFKWLGGGNLKLSETISTVTLSLTYRHSWRILSTHKITLEHKCTSRLGQPSGETVFSEKFSRSTV